MAKLKVVDAKGKAKGETEISDKLVGSAPVSVLHRVVVAEQANARQGTQSTKTRAEVRGGGRKPYRQKKTGRARQGSIRAPHYAHGGVTHAPKPRGYEHKVNRKERRLAIVTAFSSKVDSGDVIIVDSIGFDSPKTKDAVQFLKDVGAEGKRVLVVLAGYDENTVKSFRNLRNGDGRKVEVRTAPASVKRGEEAVKTQAFSTRDLLVAHKIVIAKDALKSMEEVWA